MTVVVNTKKCNGCGHLGEPQCVKICPGDLMAIDPETGKSYIKEEGDCWDCMACVKICPMRALEIKLPYQLAYYKASLIPRVSKETITWTVTDIDGNTETFVRQRIFPKVKGGSDKDE
jgi:adenylylsulfate reductase subunit B